MKLEYKKMVISLIYFAREDVVCASYGCDDKDDYGWDIWFGN